MFGKAMFGKVMFGQVTPWFLDKPKRDSHSFLQLDESTMKRTLTLATLASLGILVGAGQALADWKDDIGYTALKNRIGALLEDGAGVIIAQTEATDGNGNYLPDTTDAQFNGKTISDETGTNTGANSHATSVGRLIYGNSSSVAPGVTDIRGYSASDWAINVTGAATGTDPAQPDYDIVNASWVARSANISEADATAILYHVDAMVDRFDTIVIGASDNSGALPRLLAPSYNSIIVGKSNGTHASGQTTFYGAGRNKPDIVAPSTTTSSATAMVSSATALLYEKGMGTDAVRSETMRAVLLAGATKDEFADWDRATTRPLDEVYGAGELNVDNSYSILEGGQFTGSTSEPGSVIGEDGWDYQLTFDSSGALYYDFEVGSGTMAEDLSVILAWNAEIVDADAGGNLIPSLNVANLDLQIYDSTDSFLGTLIDESVSTVDNVEHLYFDTLSEGRYTIVVTGDQDRDFALAWSSSFTAVPEPGSALVLAIGAVGVSVIRRRRR